MQPIGIQIGSQGRPCQSRSDSAEIGLGGQPAHGIKGAIDGVYPGVNGGEHARRGNAAHVMRVKMNRNTYLLLQSVYELPCGARSAHPRHVFNAQDLRPSAFELPRQIEVIVQGPLRTSSVKQITSVADGGFA